ncbi:MarR family protein [Pseudooceanicola antarcticus]|uniref:MarR family protein n=1 Tax=Pseudooceanicola antarcticus TaxID=1247613 RepID=A0A285IX92_9RHOB|nr:helix-turn-helix domain-containing GNAT family N-acetyltransferase [Pseudooceanicola antarcticus]PJE25850.1 PadR family transcriptional regulator [Pseudooceanicola antarcticus]SNY52614.1 MarR family protein [Pseudooceanicola antarcticus]
MSNDPIARYRRFSRAVTKEVGALDQSFLGRGRPLGTARVLNAIGHGKTEVSVLRDYLGLDSGLLSRLLRGLETEGLVTTSAHPEDARARVARLTEAGEAEFQAYEALSNDRATRALARHPHPEALLAAMDLVASALGRDSIEIVEADPRDPASRLCLEAYYAELAARFDTGFDVSLSRDPEATDMILPRGSFLLAMSDGMAIGCVGLKGSGGPVAEIKRLWISPSARGLGLSKRLMTEIEARARALEITTLRLDTNSKLPEAVALYRNTGWSEIDRFNDDPYPDHFFEKNISS